VLQKQVLSVQLYELLRQRIVSGELPLGASLVEEKVGREYGVSRSPVREALSRLESAKLVERIGPRTRQISTPAPKFVSDIYDTWVIIEIGRAYSSCTNAPAADAHRIQTLLDGMEQSLRSRDMARHLEITAKFHDLLTRHCRNDYLLQMARDCERFVEWFSNIYYRQVDISGLSLKEHRDIARHYIDKDLLGLIASIDRHIRRQKKQVLATIFGEAGDRSGPAGSNKPKFRRR